MPGAGATHACDELTMGVRWTSRARYRSDGTYAGQIPIVTSSQVVSPGVNTPQGTSAGYVSPSRGGIPDSQKHPAQLVAEAAAAIARGRGVRSPVTPHDVVRHGVERIARMHGIGGGQLLVAAGVSHREATRAGLVR